MSYHSKSINIVLFLLAGLWACKEPDWTTHLMCCPEPGNSDTEAIYLFIEDSQLPADGISILLLTACIPDESAKKFTSVTFTIPQNAGNFSVEGQQNVVTKTLDHTRTATAVMTVGRTPGDFIVQVKITVDGVDFTDEQIVTLLPVNGQIIDINFPNGTHNLRADNTTQHLATFHVHGIATIGKSVALTLNGPLTFVNTANPQTTTLALNDQGQAGIVIKAGSVPGSALLTATFDNFTEILHLDVIPAFPDLIALVPVRQSMNAVDDTLSVLVYLDRIVGSVSGEIKISMQAFQILNGTTVEIGSFIPPFLTVMISETNAQNANVVYRTPIDSIADLHSLLYLVGSTTNDNGEPVQDTIHITLK